MFVLGGTLEADSEARRVINGEFSFNFKHLDAGQAPSLKVNHTALLLFQYKM